MAEVEYPNVGYGLAVALDEGTGTENFAVLTESATGQPVRMLAQGLDDNISILISPKGTGTVQFGVSPFNYIEITGAATGVAPRIAAAGGETNINIEILPKGFQNGTVRTTRMLIGTQSQWAAYQGTMGTNANLFVRSVSGSVPATLGPFNQFYMQPTGGTATSGSGYYNAFQIVGDAVNASAIGGTYSLISSTTMAAGARGNRVGVTGLIDAAAQSSDAGSYYYVGVYGLSQASAAASAGGAAIAHLFGANFATRASAGATGWFGQSGVEIDVRTASGATSQYTTGLSIVHDPTHAVAGSVEDLALIVTDTYTVTPTSPGWSQGIFSIGSRTGVWPAAATANLIHVQRATLSSLPAPTAANGVYFDPVNFVSNAWASPGARISKSGDLRLGPAQATWSSSGLTLTTTGKVAALSSIATAGTGYQVGGTLTTGNGGDLWQVATIDGSGGITGLTLLVAPTIVSGAAPANPVALTGSALGGSATINLTWTDAYKINLRGTINVTGIPTSSAGLSAGDVWSNAGVLTVV